MSIGSKRSVQFVACRNPIGLDRDRGPSLLEYSGISNALCMMVAFSVLSCGQTSLITIFKTLLQKVSQVVACRVSIDSWSRGSVQFPQCSLGAPSTESRSFLVIVFS